MEARVSRFSTNSWRVKERVSYDRILIEYVCRPAIKYVVDVGYLSFSWWIVSRCLVLIRIYLHVYLFHGDFVVYKLVYFVVSPHVAFATDVNPFCHSLHLRTAPRF